MSFLLHVFSHVQDVTEDYPLMELKVSVFILSRKFGVVFSKLPSVALLGVNRVEL